MLAHKSFFPKNTTISPSPRLSGPSSVSICLRLQASLSLFPFAWKGIKLIKRVFQGKIESVSTSRVYITYQSCITSSVHYISTMVTLRNIHWYLSSDLNSQQARIQSWKWSLISTSVYILNAIKCAALVRDGTHSGQSVPFFSPNCNLLAYPVNKTRPLALIDLWCAGRLIEI